MMLETAGKYGNMSTEFIWNMNGKRVEKAMM
jgi:hypothetical protein